MRLAITGATGFLGTHLATAARAASHEVVGVARRVPDGSASEGATWRRADLADRDALQAAFAGVDAVIANAALSPGWGAADDDAFFAANLTGTENTLRAAHAAGVVRVVLVSTVGVYRTRLGTPMDEASTLIDPRGRHWDWNRISTRSGYSRSKAAAEQLAWRLAAELELALTAVRPGPIVGSGDPKFTARLIRWATSGVRVLPTVGVPMVSARDVAQATVSACTSAASIGRAYNLAGPPRSLADVVRNVRDAIGGTSRVVAVPVPTQVRFDCSAAERDLGFRPGPVEPEIARHRPT